MDDVEKASMLYCLASMSVSLAMMTGDGDYAMETRKTVTKFLEALSMRHEDD